MSDERPVFSIEKDEVGLGQCVIAVWLDGRRIVVTGFGDTSSAQEWIDRDATDWLKAIPRQVSGEQWVNDRLPKS